MNNKITLRITGIGVLIAFVWMISSANMIYPQNSIDELEWAKKFFKAGSYQEAAELLKVFISKHKKSEPERLEEFSEAYYLLSKINFFLNKPDEMRDALQQLLRLSPDFEFSNTEEKEYLEKANGIKKLMAAEKYTDTAKEISKIHVSLSLINIERPGIILIEHKEKPEIKKSISFQDPKKISFELEISGEYILTFIIDNNRAAMERRITKDLDIETSISLSPGEEPVLDKAKITQQPEDVIKVKEGTKKKKKKRTIIYVMVGLVVVGGATAALLLSKGGNGSGSEGSTVGSIQVNSTPSGAQIYLDENDTGKTTNTTLTDVSIGSHTVKLVKEGYLDYQETVSVAAGQTTRASANLNKHTITITSPTIDSTWTKGKDVEIKWTTDGNTNTQRNMGINKKSYLISAKNFNYFNLRRSGIKTNSRLKGQNHDSERLTDLRSKGDILNRSQNINNSLSTISHKGSIQGTDNLSPGRNSPMVNNPNIAFPGNTFTPRLKTQGTMEVMTLSNVKIELYKGSSFSQNIVSSTTNTGTYTWKVPNSVTNGINYKIKISCTDNSSIYAESSPFKVEDRAIYIRSPEGEALWTKESGVSIRWNSVGTIDRISIDLYRRGSKVSSITANQKNNNSFDWAVPRNLKNGSEYKIRVSSKNDPSIYDESDNIHIGPGYKIISQFGNMGSPHKITLDRFGNVYTVDSWYNRIRKFSSAGSYLLSWGGTGSSDGKFTNVSGAATDRNGNVYTADCWGHNIQKFTSQGVFLKKWGTEGNGDGQFKSPLGIALDKSNNVYVVDSANQRVQKFTANGVFLNKWKGKGEGQLISPTDIEIDQKNYIYILEREGNKSLIKKFTIAGVYQKKWGGEGTKFGQLKYPNDIAVDNRGYIYVSDSAADANAVIVFTTNGEFVSRWEGFWNPFGIEADEKGSIYLISRSTVLKIQVIN